MPEETLLQLDLSGSVTFGATGMGQVRFGPVPPNERWEIHRYSTLSQSFGSQLTVYRNYVSQATSLDNTLRGESDVGGIQINLQRGESLVFDYNSGTSGDTVTARVEGTRFLRGRRAY